MMLFGRGGDYIFVACEAEELNCILADTGACAINEDRSRCKRRNSSGRQGFRNGEGKLVKECVERCYEVVRDCCSSREREGVGDLDDMRKQYNDRRQVRTHFRTLRAQLDAVLLRRPLSGSAETCRGDLRNRVSVTQIEQHPITYPITNFDVVNTRANLHNGTRRVESKCDRVFLDEEPGIHYIDVKRHQGRVGNFEKNFSRTRFFGGHLNCINDTQGRSGDCCVSRHDINLSEDLRIHSEELPLD